MTYTNGNTGHSRPLTPGIYAPMPTFFLKGSEDLDIESLKKHVVRIAQAGVGILVCGSMAEAHHLSREERIQVIKTARQALDDAGFKSRPIIAGTGVGSTRETIQITKEAAEAGADYSIVIPSGYFAGALGPDRKALKSFFKEVSEASPIPVMIYNFPGAAGGIDMDSDLIEEMALENSNLCGVKLTCGNVGKLTRIAATVSVPSFEQITPRKHKDAPFLVLGGFADFILPSLYANGHGAITGLANFSPMTLQHLWNLSLRTVPSATNPSPSYELLAEAQHLQGVVAKADRTIAVANIAGTKWLLEKHKGYGGVPRKPLSGTANNDGEKLWNHPHVKELVAWETKLEALSAAGAKSPEMSSAAVIAKKLAGITNGSTPIKVSA